jgi:Flp pilus assembly protein TadG
VTLTLPQRFITSKSGGEAKNMTLLTKCFSQRRLDRLQRGQSLVEMSVGFVLLLIILSGIVDIGRAYFIYIAMEDGTGEAALYLSIDPACKSAADGAECADPNNAEYRARKAGGDNLDWSAATITITRPEVYGVGDPVAVTIEYSVQLITPFLPRIAGLNPVHLKTHATQTIIRET